MNSLLKTKNISKTYKNKNILDSIDLEIFNNEIISIFGPSGSGKTTLLNILGLIDNNYQGELIINGKEIIKKDSNSIVRRKDIGFIFQFHHLLPEFNIYENLLLQLYFKNISKTEKNKLIDHYLNILNISKLKYKYPNEISKLGIEIQ